MIDAGALSSHVPVDGRRLYCDLSHQAEMPIVSIRQDVNCGPQSDDWIPKRAIEHEISARPQFSFVVSSRCFNLLRLGCANNHGTEVVVRPSQC